MGKVRPNYIKNAGEEFMKLYSDIVTTDFEINKELVDEYTDVSSKILRNRLAGYLIILKK